MITFEASTQRNLEGGRLHLRRRAPDAPWEITLFDRPLNVQTAVLEGVLHIEELWGNHFEGHTFETPEAAMEAVRPLVARRRST